MAEKNKLKTTKRWGEGGNILSLQRKGGLFYFIALVLIFTLAFQPVAFAYRSSAGGGKLAKFDTGKWAVGTAIGLASMSVGNAIGNNLLINAGLKPVANSWGTNYAIMVSTNQVGRAVGAMGRYYGWNPKSTIFISSLATSMASGGINPGQFGISGIGNGIALGAISGAAEGAILSSLADKNGRTPLWAGPVAGLAGGFAPGMVMGGLDKGLDKGIHSVLSSIPSAAVSLGVNSLTKNMKGEDAYIVRQAFSGVYPVVDAKTKILGLDGEAINRFNQGSSLKQLNIQPTNISCHGGASMEMKIGEGNFKQADSEFEALRDRVLKSRPSPDTFSWTVGDPNK